MSKGLICSWLGHFQTCMKEIVKTAKRALIIWPDLSHFKSTFVKLFCSSNYLNYNPMTSVMIMPPLWKPWKHPTSDLISNNHCKKTKQNKELCGCWTTIKSSFHNSWQKAFIPGPKCRFLPAKQAKIQRCWGRRPLEGIWLLTLTSEEFADTTLRGWIANSFAPGKAFYIHVSCPVRWIRVSLQDDSWETAEPIRRPECRTPACRTSL